MAMNYHGAFTSPSAELAPAQYLWPSLNAFTQWSHSCSSETYTEKLGEPRGFPAIPGNLKDADDLQHSTVLVSANKQDPVWGHSC